MWRECHDFNSFRMFLKVMQWSNHCVPWQIDLVGVFFWAPAPFVCVWFGFCFCLPRSLTKRKSRWGICGLSCVGGFVFFVASVV